jgi:hypothetical protein
MVIVCAHGVPINYLTIYTKLVQIHQPCTYNPFHEEFRKNKCINFEIRSESGRLKPSKKRLNITYMSEMIAFEGIE